MGKQSVDSKLSSIRDSVDTSKFKVHTGSITKRLAQINNVPEKSFDI